MTRTLELKSETREAIVAALYRFLLDDEGIQDDDSDVAHDLFQMANTGEYGVVSFDGTADRRMFIAATGDEHDFYHLVDLRTEPARVMPLTDESA